MKVIIYAFLLLFVGCITIYPGGVGYDRGKEKVFKGKACSTTWFGIFKSGDASLHLAKADGGLRRISYYDVELANYYLVTVYCVIAYGEREKE